MFRRPSRSTPLLLAVLGAVACKGSVDEAPKAEVSAPVATPKKDVEAPPAHEDPAPEGEADEPRALPADALAIDVAASRVGFVGAKVTSEHEGQFAEFDGYVLLDGETPHGLVVNVHTASVSIAPGMLERHLKSDDFFAVDEHPTSRFTATKIEAKPDGETTHEITGNLELVGIEKQVVFPARIEIGADRVSGTAEFAIDRNEWGISYRGMANNLIKDAVVLKIQLTAPRS